MTDCSVPERTRVGEPLPIRLSGFPPLTEVSVRVSARDDLDRELRATTTYRTNGEGRLDVTAAEPRDGPPLDDRTPLGVLAPVEYGFPLFVGEEQNAYQLRISALVVDGDDEIDARARTVRTVAGDLVTEEPGGAVDGRCFRPADTTAPGVVVADGAGGPTDRRFARALATAGFAVCRASGTDGTADAEAVAAALDWFRDRDRIASPFGVVGASRGSAAAAVVAAGRDDVRALVGYAPTAYALSLPDGTTIPAGRDAERALAIPGGEGDAAGGAEDGDGPIPGATTGAVREALRDADARERAWLPWDAPERVAVVSGGRDRVWPATAFCERIVARRRSNGHETLHRDHPDAGHAVGVPYRDYRELPDGAGGAPVATAEAAVTAWPAVLDALAALR